MNWDWGEIGVLFVTSFVGAGLAKLIDLAASRYSQKRSRIEKKVTKILEHLKEFGELTELYRFFAYLSESLVRDEEGELIRDSSGELVIDSKILEPEPRFAEAIKSLKGADIETAIAQKIATIRLMSAEVLDLTLEIDPSGELKRQFDELYWRTASSIETILERKEFGKPSDRFDEMREALQNADEARRRLRMKLKNYL